MTHVGWGMISIVVDGTWGKYYLISVPELEGIRLPEYPKEKRDGVQEVELLRQADLVYAVEKLSFSGYLFVALDKEFRYAIIPRKLTTEEEDTLMKELPQVVVIPQHIHATMVMVEGKFGVPHARYYSPDGTLYAQGEPIVGANRTPYLEVRTTEEDKLIARVRKRNYAPVPLGWSADGRSFYFQMHTGAMSGVLAPEWPVYRLRLPDDVLASTPTPSSGGEAPPGVEAARTFDAAPVLPIAYGDYAGWCWL